MRNMTLHSCIHRLVSGLILALLLAACSDDSGGSEGGGDAPDAAEDGAGGDTSADATEDAAGEDAADSTVLPDQEVSEETETGLDFGEEFEDLGADLVSEQNPNRSHYRLTLSGGTTESDGFRMRHALTTPPTSIEATSTTFRMAGTLRVGAVEETE